MNKTRRKELEKLYEQLNDIVCTLCDLKDEEEDAYNNMPESLQYSERGEVMQENVDKMQEIIDALEEQQSAIDDLICC